jgi:hypothetical protein
MGNASALAGLLLLFGAASPASAQQATIDGAYAKLSPGNAKVARALFEAQVSTTTPPAAVAPKALSVDQIAAMKQNQGWGQVFSAMKAQGLLLDKSLGQVVARYQHRSGASSTVVSARGLAPKTAAAEPSASYDTTEK